MFIFLISFLLSTIVRAGKRSLVTADSPPKSTKRHRLSKGDLIVSLIEPSHGQEESFRRRLANQSLKEMLRCRHLFLYRSLIDNVPLLDVNQAKVTDPISSLGITQKLPVRKIIQTSFPLGRKRIAGFYIPGVSFEGIGSCA